MLLSFDNILKEFAVALCLAERNRHFRLNLSVCLLFWLIKWLKCKKPLWLSFIWRVLVSDVKKLQKINYLASVRLSEYVNFSKIKSQWKNIPKIKSIASILNKCIIQYNNEKLIFVLLFWIELDLEEGLFMYQKLLLMLRK